LILSIKHATREKMLLLSVTFQILQKSAPKKGKKKKAREQARKSSVLLRKEAPPTAHSTG
jgi:hypothetical protein